MITEIYLNEKSRPSYSGEDNFLSCLVGLPFGASGGGIESGFWAAVVIFVATNSKFERLILVVVWFWWKCWSQCDNGGCVVIVVWGILKRKIYVIHPL